MPAQSEPAGIAPVPPQGLYRPADLGALEFATTAELAPLPGLMQQPRAEKAIAFGTEIAHRGFNIFAIGATGARVQESVRSLLETAARARPTPSDWAYVDNFAAPHRPVALALPPGRAPGFAKAVHALLDDLKLALPAVFESEDYQKRRGAIEQSIQTKNEHDFAALNEKAAARSLAILRTPMGFGIAPMTNGKVVPPDQFNAWPEAAQQAMREAIQDLEKELEATLRGLPRAEKEQRDAIRELDRATARSTINQPLEELKAAYADVAKALDYIEAMQADLLEDVQFFLAAVAAGAEGGGPMLKMGGPFDRYEVNVLVTQSDHGSGAPVVEELHPTLGDLVGRIEYLQMQGALVTNFRLIKPGALHRANGGTLMLDARALLAEPFSWPALKRALTRQQVTIEDVTRFIGLTATVSLEPDPIPLDVKIVLYGDRMLYYLLSALDPEFGQHFKVLADFDDDTDRTPASEAMLARLVGGLASSEGCVRWSAMRSRA